MSYGIVFQTIVVENNGRIYHFDRSGCNNDNAGRQQDDFIVKVYENRETALKDIERFKDCFEEDLKLSGKFVNYDYYYRYLKKKIDKPISYENFKNNYYYHFQQLKTITCRNNNKNYEPAEYSKEFYSLLKEYGCITISQNWSDLSIDELRNDLNGLRIYIRKRKHYK